MPLHVARLRDSDLAAEEDPEACWYAVLLWAASWHQLPAASLPDNDAVLTKLIGLGRDLKTFRKHRAGAMRGFVKCADGRLYHPIVAEQAIAAWEGKLRQRWRAECARIKKHNQRHDDDQPQPTFEAFMLTLPESMRLPAERPVSEDGDDCPQGQEELSSGTGGCCPPVSSIQGTEIGTETGTGRLLEEDADASCVSEPDGDQAPPPAKPEPWDLDLDFIRLWNAATPEARKRAKSKAKAWVEWVKAKRLAPPTTIIAGYIRYKAMDPDVGRTGGPGLHLWLRDRTWEHWATPEAEQPQRIGDDWTEARWLAAVNIWRRDGSWDDRLGPTPGHPGCRVPPALMIQPAGAA